jgi:hypothetical protein
METEGSFPSSQEFTNGSYPDSNFKCIPYTEAKFIYGVH